MELLILLYLLALTGYVIYLRLKKVPSIEREAEEKISETKNETLCAIKEAESTLMQAILFCRAAAEKNAHEIGEIRVCANLILDFANRNDDRLSDLHHMVGEFSGKLEESTVDILTGIERNYQRTSQIQRQLEENALAGAASMDKFNSGIANIFGYDPYAALRKGRDTKTE